MEELLCLQVLHLFFLSECFRGGYLKAPGTPTYADNAAALAGGLTGSEIYKTATGELRIVV